VVCFAVVVALVLVPLLLLPVVLPVFLAEPVVASLPVVVSLPVGELVESAESDWELLGEGDVVCEALGGSLDVLSALTTSVSNSGSHRGQGQAAVKVERKRRIKE